ncbi:uncharacterized protein LOC133478673 [Phyllopteryx taeniolatus]|uniref:uncharacterized protein LOC133478673 n=1 Tax=Phyllopteryx taeniolatus TaxID=161469 RepID=UPI002AD27B0B|nr:uncharacterized protein LOC133478673 [Phyllopteryx taeniolatus]
MTMQAAFFPFLLIAARVSISVDCKSRFEDRSVILNSGTRADASAGRTRYYMRPSAGSMKQSFFLVALPLRRHRSNFVSILDLRRKRFVCMDSRGELYNSRQKNSNRCLFSRIASIGANRRGSLFLLSHPESRELASVFLKRFLAPLVRRQRRSEEVNPSDPLRSESLPSHSVKEHKDSEHGQPEPDQAGAVSKETISSCDDPLKVLHTNGPVSPVKTIIEDLAEQD